MLHLTVGSDSHNSLQLEQRALGPEQCAHACLCILCAQRYVCLLCHMLALSLLIEEKDLGEGTNWPEQQQWGVLKSLRQWLLTKSNGGISAFNKPVKLSVSW